MALTKVSRGLLTTSIVDNGNATAITIDSSENVGIGGSPNAALDVTVSGSGIAQYVTNTSSSQAYTAWGNSDNPAWSQDFNTPGGLLIGIDSDETAVIYQGGNKAMRFGTNATERMRIDSAGNLLIGTTASASEGLNLSNGINIGFSEGANSSIANIFRQSSSGATIVASGYKVTSTANKFESSFASPWARTAIGCFYGGIRFYADAEATVAVGTDITPTERMRLDSSGILLVGTTSSTLGGSNVIAAGVESSHTTGAQTMTVYNSSTSCGANGILLVGTARGANGTFDLFNCWTSAVGDKEFKVQGDGNVFADGTFSGGGADYAEFFEWLDGNSSAEDRRGYSVVLDSGKIRVATSEDNASQIIGVISANPAMIGDNDMERWRGKYLRDDFGAYDLDANGDKQLSPDYDEAQPYVPREERVEWDIVGLMGKLRIRKGQPTGSSWIKIKDISTSIEEWLVR